MGDMLTVSVEEDGIVIRLPWPALKAATEYCPRLEVLDPVDDRPIGPAIIDLKAWAKEVVHEMNSEGENGDTLVTRMFDAAFERAAEQGPEGIRCHGEEP